jgi:hypothetical protein
VRVVRTLASICAVVALIVACVAGDPSGSLSGDDGNDDVPTAADASPVLPASRAEPELALCQNGSVFVDQRSPISRLTTLDIFRPPRALG